MNLDLLIHNTPFPLAIFDRDKTLAHASPAFFARFPDGKLMQSCRKIFAGQPRWLAAIENALRHKIRYALREDSLDICPLLDENHTLRGFALFFDQSATPFFSEEHRDRHETLQRIQLIADGLAHEIRNPLVGIKGAAQLIQKKAAAQDSIQEYCAILIRETERINRLVGNLMNLGETRPLPCEILNVHKPLREAAASVKLATRKNIEILEDFDPSLPPISASPDALQQIFLNLIKNAEEAMAEGKIRLKTAAVNEFRLKADDKIKKQLCVQIIDNGPGLSQNDLQKIFTPYYSTKKAGAGLGLTIAHHLVEQQGGHLHVKSRAGEGTTFSVFLPYL